MIKCARIGCVNEGREKYCGYHRCPICLQQKSSNDTYCRLCQENLDKMNRKKEGPAQASPIIQRPQSIGSKEASRSPMDMMKELIGMDDIKAEIYNICRDVVCEKKQKEKGIQFGDLEFTHFVITGNPGTGKTTIAKMMGKILHFYGVIESPTVHIYQRESLVAAYVGQTAIKTKNAITATRGGICFIDEAYRLSSYDTGKDFGLEAIEEIMSFMTQPGYTFIFAGYPGEMKKFIESNPGIQRRLSHTVSIRDYTHEEIADMFIQLVVKSRLEANFVRDDIVKVLRDYIDKGTMSKFNAGLASRLFKLARTSMNETFSLTKQMSPPTLLSLDDVKIAASRI